MFNVPFNLHIVFVADFLVIYTDRLNSFLKNTTCHPGYFLLGSFFQSTDWGYKVNQTHLCQDLVDKWEHLLRSTCSFCFSRAFSPDILVPGFASFVHWLYNTIWWFLYFCVQRVLTRVHCAGDCAQGVFGSLCREYCACDLYDKIKVCLDLEFI